MCLSCFKLIDEPLVNSTKRFIAEWTVPGVSHSGDPSFRGDTGIATSVIDAERVGTTDPLSPPDSRAKRAARRSFGEAGKIISFNNRITPSEIDSNSLGEIDLTNTEHKSRWPILGG